MNLKIVKNIDFLRYVLLLGDPTTFGNLKPPQEVFDAVKESLDSVKFNGYAPSTGKSKVFFIMLK